MNSVHGIPCKYKLIPQKFQLSRNFINLLPWTHHILQMENGTNDGNFCLFAANGNGKTEVGFNRSTNDKR